MVGDGVERYLDWLEREEQEIGFDTLDEILAQEFEDARRLFFEETGYELTEGQFDALRGASELRYEELPAVGIQYGRIEQTWGYQEVFRDIVTGRFVAKSDVFNLLAESR